MLPLKTGVRHVQAISYNCIRLPRLVQAWPADLLIPHLEVREKTACFIGPGKQRHESFIPSRLLARADEQVQLAVINSDDMAHSIAIPGFSLNIAAVPGEMWPYWDHSNLRPHHYECCVPN